MKGSTWKCIAVMAVALAIFAAIVIRNFSGPIGDHSESFLYEYLSYYVSKNLTFTPLPHLNLVNDQVFYPFGTNQALQSFCVERDMLFALLSHWFGRGPWLQLYYFGGLIVATFGTFALLRRDHGGARATAAAIFANLFNFYGAQKYPYHFNIACVHWVTLGIVCDFVIVERIVARRNVSISLLLLRNLLLVLSFGLELGHILGYGLTSALVTSVFTLVTLIIRHRRGERSLLKSSIESWGPEWRAHRVRLLAIASATGIFAVLYGSIVAQIVKASRAYDFGKVDLGVWWSQPVRLLIPYTPWVHPSQQPRFRIIWGDLAEESIGSGGAGIFLLALAILGVWKSKKRLRFLPLFIIFFAFVVSRPGFDLVRWMPWFMFTRVFSRATLIYSVVLALFAIDIDFSKFKERTRQILYGALAIVGGLEIVTLGIIKAGHPAFSFDAAFMDHMAKIEKLPGEAVLDFPFCILGGNGDQANLCPYREKNKSVYALQRFHHKKVIGQYLGRIHPDQTRPFVREGWPKMWDPDEPDPADADKQLRCLTEGEWAFFGDFYYANDFSGIQLNVDRLPPGCAEKFYEHFGKPMGAVTIPRAGTLSFIPRDPSTFDKKNEALAKSARLQVDLPEHVELVSKRRAILVDVEGVSGWEWLGEAHNPREQWRWALFPKTVLSFESWKERDVTLSARFGSPFKDQFVTVWLDGREVDRWIDIDSKADNVRSTELHISPGPHSVRLEYAKGNVGRDRFAPTDPRAMAIQLRSLALHPSASKN